MTRISKKNLPSSIRSARNNKIAPVTFIVAFTFVAVTIIICLAVFIGFIIGERIGDYLDDHDEIHHTFLPPTPIPNSFIYSPFGYDKDEDDATVDKNTDIWGESFNQGRPEIGKISQVTWKKDDSIVTPNAYRVLIPSKLTRALNDYSRSIGLTDLARSYIMSDESSIEPKGFRLVTLGDGNVWYANRPFSYNDMHWISPADERGHEYFLKILIENGFLSVVNIIGNELDFDSLAAYQLTFMVVSHCDFERIHDDVRNTDDRTFNMIIPLEIVEGSTPELILEGTDDPDFTIGRLKYEENIAVIIGDEAQHATTKCDYRDKPGAMRLAATVYIADINEDNAEDIVSESLTNIFPSPNVDWLRAQTGRHWINARYRSDADVHFAGDLGRKEFSATDDEDCDGWKEENPEFCETHMEQRDECPVTCDLYLEDEFFTSYSAEPLLQ